MKNETTDQNFDRYLSLAPVHKSAHSRDLLAEGHTKWPAVTSTTNAALGYCIKIKLLEHEIE